MLAVSGEAVFSVSMAAVTGLGDFIAEHIHEIVVGLLVGGLIFTLRLLTSYRKSAKLIHRVLYGSDPAKFYEVLKRIGWLFTADAASSFQSEEDRFIAARHLVELEIISIDKEPPHRDDYSADEEGAYEAQRTKWKGDSERREAGIQSQLIAVLGESKNPQKWWDVDKYPNILVAAIIRRIYALMRRNSPLAAPSEEPQEPYARLANFADLDDNRKLIKRYFNVLSSIDPEIQRRFLTKTVLDFGYLSPLFLVTGILNRFDEDTGWKLILGGYRRLVDSSEPVYSIETKELRAFMFNCWLLWGPSVPQCNCGRWRVCNEHGEEVWTDGRKRCARELFQYGYGDENQSIDIMVTDTDEHNYRADIAAMLEGQYNPAPSGLGYAARGKLAVPYEIAGHFRWGPDLKEGEVGAARAAIVDASDGRIVLDCSSRDDFSTKNKDSANYYSAYIWMAFRITDATGTPFFPSTADTDNRWKNMLCYFEHGNIADASVLQTLKESLVAKACSSMSEMFEREWAFAAGVPAQFRRGFQLHYASAIDDSNCLVVSSAAPESLTRSGLKYPPPPIDFHPHLPQSIKAQKSAHLIEIFYNTIISRIGEAAGTALRYPVLYEAFQRGHLILDAGQGHDYASCDIPAIVEGFYAELEKQKEAQILPIQNNPPPLPMPRQFESAS